MRRRKRKRLPLGITSRVGPRTGAAETDWATAEAIADSFLSTFNDDCTDNRIKPPNLKGDFPGGIAFINDLATGQPIPVEVVMVPSAQSFHETSLPIVGGQRTGPYGEQVYISPTRGACLAPRSWRNVLLSAIRHELTHAADPAVYKDNRRWISWHARAERGQRPSLRELPRKQRKEVRGQKRFKGFCDYVQSPVETRAFLAQTATELRLVGRKMRDTKEKGFSTPAQALRAMSPTFREIEKCLLPEGRKKFLKLAAIAWENGTIPRTR